MGDSPGPSPESVPESAGGRDSGVRSGFAVDGVGSSGRVGSSGNVVTGRGSTCWRAGAELPAVGDIDVENRPPEVRSVVDPPERGPLALGRPEVLAEGAEEDREREGGVVEVLRVPLPVGVAVDTYDRPVGRGQEHRPHGPVEPPVLIEEAGFGVADAFAPSGEQRLPDDSGADVAPVVNAVTTAQAVVGEDPADCCQEGPVQPTARRCFVHDGR